MDEFVDQLNYIQDIFELKLKNINGILHDELMKRFILPVCILPMCKNTEVILFI